MSKEENKAQKVGALLNPKIIHQNNRTQKIFPYSNKEIQIEPKRPREVENFSRALFHAKIVILQWGRGLYL